MSKKVDTTGDPQTNIQYTGYTYIHTHKLDAKVGKLARESTDPEYMYLNVYEIYIKYIYIYI